MFFKVCAGVSAVSSSITAIFCVWIGLNMFACNRAVDESMGKLDESMGKIDPVGWAKAKKDAGVPESATSEADLAKERAAIERQLNQKK